MGRRPDGTIHDDAADQFSDLRRKISRGRRILYSAVVTEFITDPSMFNESEIESFKVGHMSVENPQYVDKMPRNSIMARLISDGKGQRTTSSQIFYPFFSPHFSMPVKTGEQVWIIFETPGSSLGYWICRKATNLAVDDLNYTHLDRISVARSNGELTTKEKFGGDTSEPSQEAAIVQAYGFPMGGRGRRSNSTLWSRTGDENPYDVIMASSISHSNYFVGEPVPRFTKAPTGLTLQGSNNTLISLDRDRSGGIDEIEDTTDYGRGTIDIVAGRGQTEATSAIAPYSNTRGYEEIDKTPELSGASTGNSSDDVDRFGNFKAEGDLDFENDLSRIYVSMKTDGDANFGISELTDVSEETAVVTDSGDDAYCIINSNQTRIISETDGSIKIVKKGDNEASVVISSDGKITIMGSEIYLGKESGGAVHPFTWADTLEDLLEGWQNSIQTTILGAGTALQASYVAPILGGPDAACVAAAEIMSDFSLETPREKFASEVIKGE